MEGQPVVEAVAGEEDEVVHRLRRLVREELHLDLADRRLDRGDIALAGIDAHRRWSNVLLYLRRRVGVRRGCSFFILGQDEILVSGVAGSKAKAAPEDGAEAAGHQ